MKTKRKRPLPKPVPFLATPATPAERRARPPFPVSSKLIDAEDFISFTCFCGRAFTALVVEPRTLSCTCGRRWEAQPV